MARVQHDFVDVEEAARLLDVTRRHVARLGRHGEIRYVGRGLVERDSIDEYLQERQFSRTRAWSEETAWGAIALLSGLEAGWLGQVQTSRLRSRLRLLADDKDGARELVGRARNRAEVRCYESFDFLVPVLRDQVVSVGRQRLGLVDAREDQVDGYLNTTAVEKAEQRYGLRRYGRGALVLRATSFDLEIIRHIAADGNGALEALDAAGSADLREQGVGASAVTHHLEEFARGRAR